jgi:ubiquinone/menaquinone biosynthesis C-methylase UbiE
LQSKQVKEEAAEFIYESPSWGEGVISPDEATILGRKLSYCMDDLKGINGRILEVGCARGQFIRSIGQSRPDLEAHGCDINEKAVELNRLEDVGIHYLIGDALELPYPDNHFDAVMFFDLLEHLTDPIKCLAEIRRVLKVGGQMHAYVPCEGQPGTLHWLLWKIKVGHDLKKKHRGHVQRFTLAGCDELVESAWLAITQKRTSGYWIEQVLDVLFYALLEAGILKDEIWEAHALKDTMDEASSKKSVALLGRLKNIAYGAAYQETRLIEFLNIQPAIALGLHISARKATA